MFDRLFSPITINGMSLKNRMMVSAMVTQYCREDGFTNERYIRYHETKAQGGWGLIITENYPVAPKTGSYSRIAALWTDEHIAGNKELTDRVHAAGGKICCQLYHAGATVPEKTFQQQPVAPSAVRAVTTQNIPRPMTIEEIHTLILQFGDSAERAVKAGFDAVEIHGGHGYLLHEFLSPAYNKRTDAYGGSLYNRCRIAIEIVEEVRRRVGPHFPIFFRISSDDYRMGGLSINDTRVLAMRLEEASVDCIDISQGDYGTVHTLIAPSVTKSSAFIDNARAIRKVVNIPITSCGKIYDPYMAEAVLKEGCADLVVMARTSLADPAFPNKVREGRLDEIRYCVGCVQACTGGNKRNMGCHCMVNPTLGNEYIYTKEKAAVSKQVVVVGGGVAGCQAAIAAAERGHRVSLHEKSEELGGQWLAAAIPTGKTEFNSFIFWMRGELARLDVDVHLSSEVDLQNLLDMQADAVIIATGSKPAIPPITGATLPHVYTAEDVLRSRIPEQAMAPGRHVVVIGGGMTGSETGEYLAQMRCKVDIVEMLPEILRDGEAAPNKYVIDGLKDCGANIYTSAAVKQINETEVLIEQKGKEIILEEVDTVVLAAGVRSEHTLAEQAQAAGITVVCAGDANTVKNGMRNIWEGYATGYNI